MEKPADLIEVRTTSANGAKASRIVPAKLAGIAYRAALRAAWIAKAGDLVEVLPYSPKA